MCTATTNRARRQEAMAQNGTRWSAFETKSAQTGPKDGPPRAESHLGPATPAVWGASPVVRKWGEPGAPPVGLRFRDRTSRNGTRSGVTDPSGGRTCVPWRVVSNLRPVEWP